jgi:3-oxoacyl-[acyl-carrier-protein] synthase II
MRERVAITGVGMVTALGMDARTTFDALALGTRGFRAVTLFDPLDARARIAAEVTGLDLTRVAPEGCALDWSRTDAMAVLAAREAAQQAGVTGPNLGVCLGGTTGGMLETETGLLAGPLDRIDPPRAARLLSHPLDLTTARVAVALGGAARQATLCAACSSSALAVAEGAAWLSEGTVDVVLAGGADALCRLTFFGFDALGALDPEPCRPFDVARRGLGLGEGAGFLCLEREATARARGARILALFAGAALGAEAHHITHPEPSGARAAELMTRALAAAELTPRDLDYVNAHGTGTEPNDAMEARALRAALGGEVARVLVSSSKAQLGHTLGASGALEAAVTVLALEHGIAPPTAGLAAPADAELRHVLGRGVPARMRAALSCSFGFGGTGAVLVFQAAPQAAPDSAARPDSSPPPREVAPLVVTGLAAATPGGVLTGEAALKLLDAPPAAPGASAADPVAALDPERSRRFDRGAALLTSVAERALADARLEAAGVGIVSGTAFGPLERSVRFVLRAVERGVRRANPAEFPQLVASAASGNASIYAGLTGPALGVTAGAAGAEVALSVAAAALRVRYARAFVAGAVEGFDPIVAQVLGPIATSSGVVPRTEGGGALVLELEAAARARGVRHAARWLGTWSLGLDEPFPSRAPVNPERALVMSATTSPDALALLRRASWGGCRERSVLAPAGFHEALSAVALVAAAAAVIAGDADEALALSGSGPSLWVTHFERVELAP